MPEGDAEIIEMAQGPDGKWAMVGLRPNASRSPSATAEQSSGASEGDREQAKPLSPRERWEQSDREGQPPEGLSPRERWRWYDERKDRQKPETQRQQMLSDLENNGHNCASLLYTSEGQQKITDVRQILTQIVDKEQERTEPSNVSVHPGFDRSPQAIEQTRQLNESLMAAWQRQKQERVEELLRGVNMHSGEERVYVTMVLGREPRLTPEDSERRIAILDDIDRTRRDIGRALVYQASEARPLGERHLLLPEGQSGLLGRLGINPTQAQEAFARGWEEVKIGAQRHPEEVKDIPPQESSQSEAKT